MNWKTVVGVLFIIVIIGLCVWFISTKTPEEEEPPVVKEDDELIAELIISEYGENNVSVITVPDLRERYALGTFTLREESDNSRIFYAAKDDNDQWVIVFDGGEDLCSSVDPYNFPEDMISECTEKDESSEDGIEVEIENLE